MFTIIHTTDQKSIKVIEKTIQFQNYNFIEFCKGMKQPENTSVFIFPEKADLITSLQNWEHNFYWVSDDPTLLGVQQWHGKGILTSGENDELANNIIHHVRRICEEESVREEISKKRYFISERVYKDYFTKIYPIKTRPPLNIDGDEELIGDKPEKITNELRKIYDQIEKENLFIPHPRRTWEYVQTLMLADIKLNDIVLEVGSGASLVSYWLAKRCKKVYSLDPAYVNEREKAKIFFGQDNIEILQGSSCSIDMIPDNSIDKIIMISAIEHFSESEDAPKKALIECRRVLKPRGIITGTTDFASESDFRNLGERKYDKKSFLNLVDGTGLKLLESNFNIYFQGRKVFVPSIHYITLGFFLTK